MERSSDRTKKQPTNQNQPKTPAAFDRQIKIVLVGESNVGKTKLAERITNDIYKEEKVASVGFCDNIIYLQIDGQRVRVDLWDTHSSQTKAEFSKIYFRKADGVILVYDVTNTESFDCLGEWRDYVSTSFEHADDVLDHTLSVMMVVGAKADLTENVAVSTAALTDFAKIRGLDYCQVSAKTGQGVQSFFQKFVRAILKNQDKMRSLVSQQHTSRLVNLNQTKPPKKRSCC